MSLAYHISHELRETFSIIKPMKPMHWMFSEINLLQSLETYVPNSVEKESSNIRMLYVS